MSNFWLIYLVSKGYNLVNAAYMDILFWFTLLIFEIPTGFIADKFGRKTSLFLSFATQTGAIVLFAIAPSLYIFLLSYFILAIGLTMQSGAEEAWLYDEIVFHYGDDSSYQRIYGNMIGIGLVAAAFAGYSSGFIAEIALVYTIYANAFVLLLASIWVLVIPHSTQFDIVEKPPRVIDALSAIGTKRVISLGLLQIVVGAAIITIVFWFQTYLHHESVPFFFIGIILSTGSVLMALASKYNERLSRGIGNITPYLLPIIGGFVIISMSLGLGLAILGYWLIHLVRGIWNPILSKLINSELVSNIRATALSIISAGFTIAVAIAELSTAVIIQRSGYHVFFVINGSVLVIIVVLLLIIRKKSDPVGYLNSGIISNPVSQ